MYLDEVLEAESQACEAEQQSEEGDNLLLGYLPECDSVAAKRDGT